MPSSPAASRTPFARILRTPQAPAYRWPNPTAEISQGRSGLGQQVVSLVPQAGETTDAFVARVAEELKRRGTSILMVMAYGSVRMHDVVIGSLARALGGIDWPMLWVEGASCFGGPLAGFQIFVLPGGTIERVRLDGSVIGSVFADGDSRHCLMAGLTPSDVSLPRARQCEEFFEDVANVLAQAGFTYGDIVRTWFYNDEILSWYDDFNRVRTAFYAKQKFSCGSLPASTAVRGRNPHGAALTFGAWAVVKETTGAAVQEVASPLQCPAPAYGSSFSRATEIVSGGMKRLLVSGTASIEPGGRTIWQGDVVRQIALTMEVVDAILSPRGMGFADVARATAYFKNAEDHTHLWNWLAERGLSAMPVVPVHCDICRDDLLFEIELDACLTAGALSSVKESAQSLDLS